jgi:CBS domain containing-hemolysin-like protein
MTPRDRLITVPASGTVGDFLAVARQSNLTRFPAFDEGQDEFKGVVDLFDVLTRHRGEPSAPLADFIRPPVVVAATTPADDVLPLLRHVRQPMGLVADAGGRIAGVITMEDILMQVVGRL